MRGLNLENFPTFTLVVAGALKRSDGRWLMHRRPEGKHHAGLWEFPGGKIEPGEMPRDALRRELLEELGIKLPIESLHPVSFACEDVDRIVKPVLLLLFASDHWQGNPTPLEGGEIDWFMPGQIADLPKPPLDEELVASLFRNRPEFARG